MKLEEQVVSLEYAKKLKELGVKKESLFYWGAFENPPAGRCKEEDVPDDFWMLGSKTEKHFNSCDWYISAFTVAELGEMLPDNCGTSRDFDLGFTVWTYEKTEDEKNFFVNHYHTTDTEANARAKMIIDLLENNLIKLDDINAN